MAFLAYVPMNETHEVLLQAARLAVRDTLRVATCVGFGPRYLHSTGQAYKGGPTTRTTSRCRDGDIPSVW